MRRSGLLYSCIGYDLGDPKRAVFRCSDSGFPGGCRFELKDARTGAAAFEGEAAYWGEKWREHWWILDFTALDTAGEYIIILYDGEKILEESRIIELGENLLCEKTIDAVALDQLEERSRRARNGFGWKDCGSDWREACSHSATVIGLEDLLDSGYEWLGADRVKRLKAQLTVGCSYLASCQDKAGRLGYPKGAVVHELPNYMDVIPGDAAQCIVAFARFSRYICEDDPGMGDAYLERAKNACDFFTKECRPYGRSGFSPSNHGAPADFEPPDEFMTRDLAMVMWGAVELYASGLKEYKAVAVEYAKRIMARQVPRERAEDGLYGHFHTFGSCDFTEKANVHHHVGHDTGALFPHYILPFMDMLTRFYDHPDAEKWRRTVMDFAYGYFLPACGGNPFFILPEGYFKDEGLLVFAGPWHGINATLGFAATLAVQLEAFTGDRAFRNISAGNIQWIAGLNTGFTGDSFTSTYFWREDIPPHRVECRSQIYGIGSKHVGCWSGIRGTIVNGFSANPQFKLAVPPVLANDLPAYYTDEDWIPHAGGWVSAISALRKRKQFSSLS